MNKKSLRNQMIILFSWNINYWYCFDICMGMKVWSVSANEKWEFENHTEITEMKKIEDEREMKSQTNPIELLVAP